MSKKRSDWESRPQARIKKWFFDGYSAFDDEIINQISVKTPDPVNHAVYDAYIDEISANKHERKLMIEKFEDQNVRSWINARGRKVFTRFYVILSFLLACLMIFFLLRTVAEMPRFGSETSPGINEVTARYIEKGLDETGAMNIVAGMILDYRAFDTLGESTVLFIAASAVLILLRIDRNKDGSPVMELIAEESDDRHYEPRNDRILQGAAKVLVPIIFLFGIYIILNGHLSPGGGFSGGAIISAGLILYLDSFGFEKAGRFFTYSTFSWVSFISLSFYALAKTYSFYMGANGMESGIPLGTPGAILSSGLILPLNIAVGMVVACTMYIFYALFRKGGL